MSSAQAAVEDIAATTAVRDRVAPRPTTALTIGLIAITQATWLAALAYGAFWLLT